jgi:hypothetical protein
MFSTKRRREVAWFVIGSLAVALLLLALYAILTTRQLVGSMRATQKGSVTTLHVVRDCTTPGSRATSAARSRPPALWHPSTRSPSTQPRVRTDRGIKP